MRPTSPYVTNGVAMIGACGVATEISAGETPVYDESSEYYADFVAWAVEKGLVAKGADAGAVSVAARNPSPGESGAGKFKPNGDPMYVWEDFVAGTDPANSDDKFKIVDIRLENGELKVVWSPDLNEGGKKSIRTYTEYGRKELGSEECWTDMQDVKAAEKNEYRFRKVTVGMPPCRH